MSEVFLSSDLDLASGITGEIAYADVTTTSWA